MHATTLREAEGKMFRSSGQVLKEATGGEFRVYRASTRPLVRYIDLI